MIVILCLLRGNREWIGSRVNNWILRLIYRDLFFLLKF